ncbi:glycosyltransferase [Wenxinia saemankumensis]|uniref:Glycosyltransferase, GT2 family n=1 Tax=Wenxinia saemankumensis TaxID=1447782 RepID=A0A1M6FZF2_9RHOB|nr:glycosyltransferase [Wenxinia saemankumensis]SHJ02999.1 Glycosyltransferase, GT2 family [Wenxinia saemankumensis]
MTPLAAIVIGRNEEDRLLACLRSLQGRVDRLIYADSGSTDGSLAAAAALGVETVALSPPHTAARGRNAGAAALGDWDGHLLFVDGDCTVDPGWPGAARAALDADPGLGLVTGWRRERYPERSIFNRMAEVEWHRPAGEIRTCGGDMAVRAAAFRQIGGFDAGLIAAEDDDFCLRLGKAGWRLQRLPVAMTEHDMDMTNIRQWWRRAVRSGHGFAQVGEMHPPHCRRDRLRVIGYCALAAFGVLASAITPWAGGAVLAILAISLVRTARGLRRAHDMDMAEALHQAAWLLATKLPNLVGIAMWHLRRRERPPEIIEYK